jgi:flap endonuclease-1
MGIKDINKILKEHSPFAFKTITLESFSGYRIAIDARNYIYAPFSKALDHEISYMRNDDLLKKINYNNVLIKTCKYIIDFLQNLSHYNIIVVWVWDGKSPDEKIGCLEQRAKDRQRTLERLNLIVEKLNNCHILARESADIAEYKKILSQIVPLTRKRADNIKNFIESLGFPSLQAETEGEKLASNLATKGLVIAVWSKDTDNYALGTPITITGFSKNRLNGKQCIDIVILPEILEGINKPHEWLVDLCIMLGCDFNNRIYGLGAVNACKLLSQHNNIENIIAANTKWGDMSQLNHERCREIFSVEDVNLTETSDEINFNYEVYSNNVNDIIVKYQCAEYIDKITSIVKNSRHKPTIVEFT